MHILSIYPVVEVLDPPKPSTVLEEENAVFTCAVRANEIKFFINGELAESEKYKNNGSFI